MKRRLKRAAKHAAKFSARICKLVFVDKSSPQDTVVLISSGRSGSTWLAEILRTVPNTRLVLEPFHPTRGVAGLSTYRYTYLQPAASQPALECEIDSTLNGRRRTAWTEQLNKVSDFYYRRRIVKLVRVNLLFPWLTDRFPTFRFVFLIRHPGAVVASQLRNGWELSSRRLREQSSLSSRIDLSVYDRFDWPQQGFLSNLIFWAIENRIAYDNVRKSGALVVKYEELCSEPARELARLSDHIGIEFPAGADLALERSSWSGGKDISALSGSQKASGWRQQLSADQLGLVHDVLEVSGLDTLYSGS